MQETEGSCARPLRGFYGVMIWSVGFKRYKTAKDNKGPGGLSVPLKHRWFCQSNLFELPF